MGVGSAFPGEGAARAALLRHAGGRAFGVLAGADAVVTVLAADNVWATHNLVDAAFGRATSSSADGPVQLHVRCVPRLLSELPELAQLLSMPHARRQACATLECALEAGRARMDSVRHAYCAASGGIFLLPARHGRDTLLQYAPCAFR